MTAPKLPKTLRIGHITYTVSVDDAYVDRSSIETQVDAHAMSSYTDQRIALRKTLVNQDTRAECLLHEVIHQTLRIGAYPWEAKDVSEELVVQAIAGPLLAALRDNPEFAAYLLHQEP